MLLSNEELWRAFTPRGVYMDDTLAKLRAVEAAVLARTSQVEVADPVQVFYYEHSCDWVSKYCDEHHRRSALVSRAALGGGDHAE